MFFYYCFCCWDCVIILKHNIINIKIFFLCSCLFFSYILAHFLLMFLLIFFLHSHSFFSYILAHLLLTFSLVFFLHFHLSFFYVLACFLLMFLLVISSHRLIMNICHRLYILLNQISKHIIKQFEEIFLKIIFRFFLANFFSAKLTYITVFLTKMICYQAV